MGEGVAERPEGALVRDVAEVGGLGHVEAGIVGGVVSEARILVPRLEKLTPDGIVSFVVRTDDIHEGFLDFAVRIQQGL